MPRAAQGRKDDAEMLRMKLKYMLFNKRNRLILLMTLGISLCISAIGMLSYVQYRHVLDSEINTPNVELLQINLDVTNRAFREGDNKAVDASFHPAVLAFVRGGSAGGEDTAAVLRNYLQTLAHHPDIHSIEVAAADGRSEVSGAGGPGPAGAPEEKALRTAWTQELQTKPLLVKRRPAGSLSAAPEAELLTLIRPVRQDGRVAGAIIVNLDYDRLFSKMYTQLTSHQYVFNLEGELIYPKLNGPVPLSEMISVIKALDVRPYANVRIGGKDYLANQTFSDVTGWRLLSLVSMEKLLKNARAARDMMLLLSLISILIGCGAVYSYSYAAFRPLKRINKLIDPSRQAEREGDLHELEPLIGKLVEDFNSHSLVARQSLPELQGKFLQDLLMRSLGSRELRSKWEHYFQEWAPGGLSLVVVSVDRVHRWAEKYSDEDVRLLKYALTNIVLEVLEPAWRAVSTEDRKDGVAVLVQPKELESDRELTEQLGAEAERIRDVVGRYLGISVSIGIGSSVQDIAEAVASHAEARRALSRRLFSGYGSVHIHEDGDAAPRQEELRALSGPESTDWLAPLLGCGVDACSLRMEQWSTELHTGGRSPGSIYREADEMVEELLRLAASHGLTPPAGLADYTPQEARTVSLAELAELLKSSVCEMSVELSSRQQSREYLTTQSIIGYMEQNLDQNIGLQDIAEHVQLGISSVSAIFKEETGSTVYDYLTSLRMEKACRLLVESPLKMAEIAQQVGYQNENSFIRVFRKHKSITPGRYRETHRSSSAYADPPKARSNGVSGDSLQD